MAFLPERSIPGPGIPEGRQGGLTPREPPSVFPLGKTSAMSGYLTGEMLLVSLPLKWQDWAREVKHRISLESLTFCPCSYALLIVVNFQHLINYFH